MIQLTDYVFSGLFLDLNDGAVFLEKLNSELKSLEDSIAKLNQQVAALTKEAK
jgi:hypothetical protein